MLDGMRRRKKRKHSRAARDSDGDEKFMSLLRTKIRSKLADTRHTDRYRKSVALGRHCQSTIALNPPGATASESSSAQLQATFLSLASVTGAESHFSSLEYSGGWC